MINALNLPKHFLESIPGQKAYLRYLLCNAWACGKLNDANYQIEKLKVNSMNDAELVEKTEYYNSLLKNYNLQ